MPSCLGLYIDKNLIKYAKVTRDKTQTKIEAHGVKFYENIEETVQQIIKETYSFQIPICINLTREQYKYSSILNLLKPKDFEKAVGTEFEYYCSTSAKNPNTLEYRYLKHTNTTDKENRDKIDILYVYTDKANVVEKIQLLDTYKIGTISPVALTIPNVNQFAEGENSAYVNIEDTTEITIVSQGHVEKVEKLEKGMDSILQAIAVRENSISRAYEACKNTTVYTKAGQNLKIDGNEYLDDIILGLSDVMIDVKKVIDLSEMKIDNIYLTGTGIVINNIDLFFQENFMDKKVELLIPYFTEKTNTKINVKDYAEVNSAISLAMQGLDTKNNLINFSNKGTSALSTLKDILTSDIGKDTGKQLGSLFKFNIKESLSKKLDGIEKAMLRLSYTLLFVIVIYIVLLNFLTSNINDKIDEANKVIDDTNNKITQITEYKRLIDAKTSEYSRVIAEIEENSNEITNSYLSKNAIPNLLNKIMQRIPQGVQLVSIENTYGKKITIKAQAEKYDQLGYFKTVLAEEGILTNVTTTKGENIKGTISITIEGDLPY